MALAGAMGACSTVPGWTPLNGPALRVSQPHSLTVVVEDPGDFHVHVPPSMLYLVSLAIGATATAAEAADAAGDYGDSLKEPSPRVAKKLAAILAKRYQVEIRGIRTADDTSAMVPSDLTLDVATIDWALDCTTNEKSDSWSEQPPVCEIIYRARVKLTDNRDKRILAAGDCQSVPMRPLLVPEEDSGMKINMPHVQSALKEAADNCVDRLRRQLFGIYGALP